MNENERLRVLRKELGLTLEKFGEKIGVKKSAVSDVENGRHPISLQMFKLICREFGVNESWLRDGDGEMFVRSFSGTLEALREEYALDDFSMRLVKEYLSLSPDKRALVREFFERVVDEVDERESLHNELDRQIDLEKREKSEVS